MKGNSKKINLLREEGKFHADWKSIAMIWIACRFGADQIWFAFT
jgi:hypothetical protein